jgi:Fe-S cluster biosynthesis and repair protein YggX
LAASKSFLSMPSRLGIEPAKIATSMSRNATASWSVHTTSLNNGNEQSLVIEYYFHLLYFISRNMY